MKPCVGILCAALLFGGGGTLEGRGAASSPGGEEAHAANPAAAGRAATNGAYEKIGTNVNTEREANQALTRAAKNSPSIGGNVTTPGGTAVHGGSGTGKHGFIFWFYVALDCGFLVWLVLAIRHRVRKPAAAGPAHG